MRGQVIPAIFLHTKRPIAISIVRSSPFSGPLCAPAWTLSVNGPNQRTRQTPLQDLGLRVELL